MSRLASFKSDVLHAIEEVESKYNLHPGNSQLDRDLLERAYRDLFIATVLTNKRYDKGE